MEVYGICSAADAEWHGVMMFHEPDEDVAGRSKKQKIEFNHSEFYLKRKHDGWCKHCGDGCDGGSSYGRNWLEEIAEKMPYQGGQWRDTKAWCQKQGSSSAKDRRKQEEQKGDEPMKTWI